jgi:hypothetical protein
LVVSLGWRNWSTHWVCSDTFHAFLFLGGQSLVTRIIFFILGVFKVWGVLFKIYLKFIFKFKFKFFRWGVNHLSLE